MGGEGGLDGLPLLAALPAQKQTEDVGSYMHNSLLVLTGAIYIMCINVRYLVYRVLHTYIYIYIYTYMETGPEAGLHFGYRLLS